MGSFVIQGGKKLRGEITPQGAKNEALQVISAALLTPEKVTINNLPIIQDVINLIDILQDLGVKVGKIDQHSYTFEATDINLDYLESPEFRRKAGNLRGSVLILGPLLARFGSANLPRPGGDKIGRRRLDTHFTGLQKLGARLNYDAQTGCFRVESDQLQGNYILLDEASVTGTANLIMAASLAKGKTIIFNAACEPYIVQLCRMLNNMGAKISGIGSNLLTIEGVEYLSGCEHTLMPDIIEVGSFIGLAAMTQSEITIKDTDPFELGLIPEIFRRLGIQIVEQERQLVIPEQEVYHVETFLDGSIMTIADAPWPGFSPDLISIALVVAVQAQGSVLIHQKMFESRLYFVDKLIDMGARIILCDPHRATVIGLGRKYPLRGLRMSSPDIRAGVALLIAALSAQGESIIDNIEQIDRGYEAIDLRLKAIGAEIVRI